MIRFVLHPHQVASGAVTFRWTVTPASSLYRRCEFALRFPPAVDLSCVPDALWPRIALLCLHPHWMVLRPCRVELPFGLDAAEIEFWRRLMDAGVNTLEAYRGSREFGRAVELCCHGPALAPFPRFPESQRCATAFSGGKDSLLQTGLLAELTERPLLVTTTSPMPPYVDHITARRRAVLKAVPQRRDVELLEVESDFRTCVDNNFALNAHGYRTGMNELTDTLLYSSSLLAAAVARGATHLFVAAEAEVHENAVHEGRTIQHSHFMYSTVTQGAVSALLAPLGVRLGSLTAPLYSSQVQALLWTRYRDLRDLQYSCWNVPEGAAACSRCRQCLRVALGALALHDRPGLLGIDLAELFREQRDWTPPSLDVNAAALPNDIARARISTQIALGLRATPVRRVWANLLRDDPGIFLRGKGWRALAGYRQLRRRARALPLSWTPGFRRRAVALLDPLLRERVGSIYAEHFPAESEAAYAAILERSQALSEWIAAPLQKVSSCRAQSS
jgi:hypothetical protein